METGNDLIKWRKSLNWTRAHLQREMLKVNGISYSLIHLLRIENQNKKIPFKLRFMLERLKKEKGLG